jgi:DNA-directed RNA polymerase specialized sigma subunit
LIDVNKDINDIKEWQATRDPGKFAEIIVRYQPVINSVVNRYQTVGVAPATLRAKATTNLIKAINSFDPDRGTQPSTHIWNSLQGVQRMAAESQISGHIPEHRNLRRSTFNVVKQNLEDRLGYEPNIDELADELSWDKREVGRMISEAHGEATASQAEFDFYGNSLVKEHEDKPLVDYLYHELSGPDKTIFEHTFGFGGKPVLNNKEIARKLNTNEMAVHRAKKRLADRIRDMR